MWQLGVVTFALPSVTKGAITGGHNPTMTVMAVYGAHTKEGHSVEENEADTENEVHKLGDWAAWAADKIEEEYGLGTSVAGDGNEVLDAERDSKFEGPRKQIGSLIGASAAMEEGNFWDALRTLHPTASLRTTHGRPTLRASSSWIF